MARILVIDDDDDVREMLKELLERKNYEVVVASNGREGIDIYRQEPADLVITDIIMPEKDGVDTIYELGKEFPLLKVIAISGGGRGNANDYLESTKMLSSVKYSFTKPFATEDILKAVNELLAVNS
ncbi:MAG: hypothetical protein A2Y03_00820 [Omnitrophica WOR_2 bacterium GWF2_38_59]|nr:MAG: hypothetical protein A2Y06_03565 [Omnitrophica WOR_2 bacterium GWA2_37_7]OGX23986.1 MAG: hypothetical protein A2Y03_00820 [Omnitrophica WOR_2 bacterium GWF2_38_59]OGX46898.1 MAG: hypothetical protein A2243_11940 [Omnitrophica WOR_2 bacterium RIFOXYA2_FULL_38_17]OGX52594.1 MAG: hypothetical protein A2267_03750 [Omnitrophica WOR_2 bacterium RIFOXYA12_FULL_38_10]OGX56480.1 MAG: hypothetical protein A2447_10125 [Omnitrophica WOR_2 bacterium RIFOXYC2_FULL_38_12]OGX58517.1 MAG: hypothetical 